MKKNMSRFLYIFAFGIFLNVSYISGVGSAPASKSIMDEIRDDKDICPTLSFLYNSNYTNECTKIKYPSKSLNFSEEYVNTFLCLGLYDISYRICYLKSRHSDVILNLPTDENQLDSQLKQVAWSNNSLKFCEQLQSVSYPPIYKKTQLQVTKLNSALMQPYSCQRICFDFNEKLNPLCSIWVWATQLPISKNPSINQLNGTQHDSEVSIPATKSEIKKNNQALNKVNTIKEKSPILEVVKTYTNKLKDGLLSDKENVSLGIINDHAPIPLSKDNHKTESKPVAEVETRENLNIKHSTSSDNTNKISGEMEKPIGSSTNVENEDPLQQLENTEGSITQAVTLSQNTDDQKDIVNSEDSNANNYENEDRADLISELSNSGRSFPESSERKDTLPRYPSIRNEDDSHFFAYFMVITLLCVGGYVGYHNKQKILAIVLEGRRSRGGRGRRRPNTASYRKLDCTLEEAVTSQCNSNVTHVIY